MFLLRVSKKLLARPFAEEVLAEEAITSWTLREANTGFTRIEFSLIRSH